MPVIDTNGDEGNAKYTKQSPTKRDLVAFLAGGGDFPEDHVPDTEMVTSLVFDTKYGSQKTPQFGVKGNSAKAAIKEYLEGPEQRAVLRKLLAGEIPEEDWVGDVRGALKFMNGMEAKLFDGGEDFTIEALPEPEVAE